MGEKKPRKKQIRRAVSVDELLKKKFKTFPLKGRFKELLGEPERTGHWFFFGESGHGKTTFLMSIVKELTKYERVEYNTLEEGARKSMQDAVRENRLQECRRGSFKILNKLAMDELKERLRQPKAAKVVVIDSVQYTFMTKRDFFDLDKEFGHKVLFLWNSHGRGKQPLGALAEAIMFHGDLTFYIQGFKAFPKKARGNRGVIAEPYVIWEKGARDYYDVL